MTKNLIENSLLGVIQGITEFLPISSSAHLVFFQHIFGWEKHDLLLDVLLHFGTLFALIAFFFKDVVMVLKEKYMIKLLILANLFTIGFVMIFKERIELFFNLPNRVGILLFFSGICIFLSHLLSKERKSFKEINIADAMLIGLAQGISAFPGISRSGLTISISLILGLKRETAFKFSFLISIPAIIGATFLKVYEAEHGFLVSKLPVYSISMFIAFVFGLLSLKILKLTLITRRFFIFAVYCTIFGIVMLLI